MEDSLTIQRLVNCVFKRTTADRFRYTLLDGRHIDIFKWGQPSGRWGATLHLANGKQVDLIGYSPGFKYRSTAARAALMKWT